MIQLDFRSQMKNPTSSVVKNLTPPKTPDDSLQQRLQNLACNDAFR